MKIKMDVRGSKTPLYQVMVNV